MSESLAGKWNREDLRTSFDATRLAERLEPWGTSEDTALGVNEISAFFARVPVYLTALEIRQMASTVSAIEGFVHGDAFQRRVLALAPEIARYEPRAKGVLFGYDFHIDESGPKLIEVNTNAGGALLNLLLAQSQTLPNDSGLGHASLAIPVEGLGERILHSFESDWSCARGSEPLRTIVIVDDEPERQFLYPEFLLFQRLFRKHGYRAIIKDPRDLTFENGRLWCAGESVDLVYNRLTDFYLTEPKHEALRAAYLNDSIVLTPHPRAHALFADKLNLVLFCEPTSSSIEGVTENSNVLFSHVPETRRVKKEEAAWFWSERKRWFFKPIHGYGSKAAYRGDKLTKSTFAEILERDYIAQRIVPPGERRLLVDGETVTMKFDVRCFVYDGKVELLAARLYQGQTTNFRTVGGGFAPVYSIG